MRNTAVCPQASNFALLGSFGASGSMFFPSHHSNALRACFLHDLSVNKKGPPRWRVYAKRNGHFFYSCRDKFRAIECRLYPGPSSQDPFSHSGRLMGAARPDPVQNSIKVPVFCPGVVELSGRLTGACIHPKLPRTQFLSWWPPCLLQIFPYRPAAQTWLVSGSAADVLPLIHRSRLVINRPVRVPGSARSSGSCRS